MDKLFYITWLIAIICCISSCMQDEEEFATSDLVVEGWIEEDGYPVVYLGESLPATRTEEMSLADYVIRWGKVSISDGTKTVVMTGIYTSDRLRPYRYETFNMKGEAGKTYRLQVEYREKKVTAVTTIPPKVSIDSVKAIPTTNDTLYYIKAYFKDNRQEKDYYTLFSLRQDKDPGFLLSFMGVIDDDVAPEYIEADVYRGMSIESYTEKPSTIYFAAGDVVQVQLCHIDRQSYLFWNSFSNQQHLSGNMFFPYTTNPVSNIDGGKGYWCGYGADRRTLFIPQKK